jgi:hypothetical protein
MLPRRRQARITGNNKGEVVGMFSHLRLRREPVKVGPDPRDMPILRLDASPTLPISIFAINNLSENAKRRLYRTLLPPPLLMRFRISPVSWQDVADVPRVRLDAAPGSSAVALSILHPADATEPFFVLELADNNINGFELNFISLHDPDGPRFDVDRDAEGNQTHFGTVRRKLAEEERAMHAGLSPIQLRRNLGAALCSTSSSFFAAFAHRAYSLEPLTLRRRTGAVSYWGPAEHPARIPAGRPPMRRWMEARPPTRTVADGAAAPGHSRRHPGHDRLATDHLRMIGGWATRQRRPFRRGY